MQSFELTNGNLIEDEKFSNFRILGFGTRSQGQQQSAEKKLRSRISSEQQKGRDTASLRKKLNGLVSSAKTSIPEGTSLLASSDTNANVASPIKVGADNTLFSNDDAISKSVDSSIDEATDGNAETLNTDENMASDFPKEKKYFQMERSTAIIIATLLLTAVVVVSVFFNKQAKEVVKQ